MGNVFLTCTVHVRMYIPHGYSELTAINRFQLPVTYLNNVHMHKLYSLNIGHMYSHTIAPSPHSQRRVGTRVTHVSRDSLILEPLRSLHAAGIVP